MADFGISESLDPAQTFFHQDKTGDIKLPVKWLAIESLADGIYSEKSDVVCIIHPLPTTLVPMLFFLQWAFGVTCWEIFSCGKRPYRNIDPKHLVRKLMNGYRMEKPMNSACHDSV